jgi:two-component system sensor histidine kinase PhoQ
VKDVPSESRDIEYNRLLKELEICSTVVAHDIGNYLQYVYFKIDEIEEIVDDSDECIGTKINQMRQVLKKIGTVLGFLSLPARLTDDPMVSIIQQISTYVEEMFDELQIKIIADEEARQMRVVGGHLLPMVFANIFMNSVVHAGNDVKVEVRIEKDGNEANIIIGDNGPGIEPSIREKLFQKGVSTTGGGLGLYLSREILKIHEGTIELIESNDFRGAVFQIRLSLSS